MTKESEKASTVLMLIEKKFLEWLVEKWINRERDDETLTRGEKRFISHFIVHCNKSIEVILILNNYISTYSLELL